MTLADAKRFLRREFDRVTRRLNDLRRAIFRRRNPRQPGDENAGGAATLEALQAEFDRLDSLQNEIIGELERLDHPDFRIEE